MLTIIANQFDRSFWKRHLFFLGTAIITIFIVGYHYGTFDMAIHIPFLKAMADPTLFPNDTYIALHSTYFSYFWFFFIPFEHIGHLPGALFTVHIISVYLTFWAAWEISATLFHNPLASLFSVLAFIAPHIGFVGFPVIEFGVMSRTFVLPYLLFAINLFLQRRTVPAFLLAGLMYNLHVVIVNFVLAMFLLDCSLEYKRIGIKNILLGLATFVLAALPVLVWKSTAGPIDFSLRPEWYTFLVRTMPNVFVLFSAYPQIIIITCSGFSCLVLFLIANQFPPSPAHEWTLRIFIAAVFIILFVGQLIDGWVPMTILIQSQINRAGLFLLIFAYIYFAGYLAQRFQTETERESLIPLSLAFFLFPTPILALLVMLVQKVLPTTRRMQIELSVGVVVLSAVVFFMCMQLQIWNPKLEIYGEDTPWVDVQTWAKTNTLKDAIFITPPEEFGLYQSDWRVYSERSTFATYSEILVAAFNPHFTDGWVERFKMIAPGAMSKFGGDYFINTELTKEAYYSLSVADIEKLSCTQKVSYIVMEKPHTLSFTLIYENQQFTVYDLRMKMCDQ